MSLNDASRIVNDDSKMMLHIVVSLTDDSKGVIYDHNMFIVKATGATFATLHFVHNFRMRPIRYSLTLHYAGKDCLDQTL
jgi:hypothetical protein